MSHTIILGTLFLCLLMPIDKIDSAGIHTTINNQSIVLELIIEPYTKKLDHIKDLVNFKEKQLNFLQKEAFLFNN